MNPVHPATYHVVKAEQADRLARIERRAQATSSSHNDVVHHPHTSPVRRQRSLRRTAGAGLATVARLLTVLVGGALANEQASSGASVGSSSGGGAKLLR
jgi:hypothetical protein